MRSLDLFKFAGVAGARTLMTCPAADIDRARRRATFASAFMCALALLTAYGEGSARPSLTNELAFSFYGGCVFATWFQHWLTKVPTEEASQDLLRGDSWKIVRYHELAALRRTFRYQKIATALSFGVALVATSPWLPAATLIVATVAAESYIRKPKPIPR